VWIYPPVGFDGEEAILPCLDSKFGRKCFDAFEHNHNLVLMAKVDFLWQWLVLAVNA